jgi:hypothetical protein
LADLEGGDHGDAKGGAPEGVERVLRAIDLTIAEVESRGDDDRDDQLATLKYMLERWREKAMEERRS